MRKRSKLALGVVAAVALAADTVAATTAGGDTVTDTSDGSVYIDKGDRAAAPGTPVAPVELTPEEQARGSDSSDPSPPGGSGEPGPEKNG